MTVEHVELLVEEPSMEAVLRILVPRLLGDLSFAVRPHQCKDDLLSKLPHRLSGYASWIPKNWRIVILIDRDDDDCDALKARLESCAEHARLTTKSKAKRGNWVLVNRVAIEELEAWYFGDWQAVRAAYPRAAPDIPSKSKYRSPDGIAGGTWEAFERLLQKAGYFTGGLRKIEAARNIAAHMDPQRNTSPSFCIFRDVLLEIASS